MIFADNEVGSQPQSAPDAQINLSQELCTAEDNSLEVTPRTSHDSSFSYEEIKEVDEGA